MSDAAEVKTDIEETLGFYDGVEEAIPDALRGVLDAARRWVRAVETGEQVWRCREMPFWTPDHTEEDYEGYRQRLMDPNDEMGDAGHYCSPFAAHYEGCGWVTLVAAVGVEKEKTDG